MASISQGVTTAKGTQLVQIYHYKLVGFVEELTAFLRKTLFIFPYSGKVVEDLDISQEIRAWPYGYYNSNWMRGGLWIFLLGSIKKSSSTVVNYCYLQAVAEQLPSQKLSPLEGHD